MEDHIEIKSLIGAAKAYYPNGQSKGWRTAMLKTSMQLLLAIKLNISIDKF